MIEKIEVQSRMFDGEARIFIFPNVDPNRFTKETVLALVLKSPVDCGQIVEGSGSWDGDETSIEVLKNTEGGVIRSKESQGTFAWSARIPHSKETAMIAGGRVHKLDGEKPLGEDFVAAEGEDVIGLNPKDMTKYCPVAVLNLAHSELQLFPKAKVIFSPTHDDDGLREYIVKAQAEDIYTKHLSTMMYVPLGDDPMAEDYEDEAGGAGA